MIQKKMEITFSPLGDSGFTEVGQTVNFVNILEGAHIANAPPTQISYNNIDQGIVALWNYYTHSLQGEQNTETQSPEENTKAFGLSRMAGSETVMVSVFRQEIQYGDGGEIIPLSPLEQIATRINIYSFKDYNVSNGRLYRYLIFPASEEVSLAHLEGHIQTSWGEWSLTELHPIDASFKKFTASPEDVWLFKYNLEAGAQAQTTAINEQQSLGQYPRFGQGRTNYVSGSVSCLLGSEITPVEYIINQGQVETKGGYRERRDRAPATGSNEKIEMLKAWRKLVSSGNPKLLKDMKGQSFLVMVSDSSNQPRTNVGYQPDTISFTWKEIGSLDGIQIIGTLR